MTERARLLQAVNELEATFRQSWQRANDESRDNRKEGIQLRRVISEKMAEISSLGHLAFGESELHGKFRSEFSKMRSRLAFHHASWPIVTIEFDNPDYLKSSAELREASNEFIAWVKATLAVQR